MFSEVFSRLVLDFLVIGMREHFFSGLRVTSRLSDFLLDDICFYRGVLSENVESVSPRTMFSNMVASSRGIVEKFNE